MTRMDDLRINGFLWTPQGRSWRRLFALAATVSALAHLPVISPHLAEAPHMGEEFIVLTAACLLLALAAIVCDSAAVYSLGILTCGLAVAAYVATRSIAFPQLADDVGNWFEPLEVVCVLAESVAVGAVVLGLRRRRATPVAPFSAEPAMHTEASADAQAEEPHEVPDEAEADFDAVLAGPTSSSPDSAPSWPVWATPVGAGGADRTTC